MPGRPHLISQILPLLLLFAFGTLLHGCRSQHAPTAAGENATTESAVKASKASLRESEPPDKGRIWRTGVFDKPIIGHRSKESGYSIFHTFGIEQWEEGKRTTHRFQQWLIRCDYPGYFKKHGTECSLERLVIDRWLVDSTGGATVSEHRHSEEEGNFKLRKADWEKGRIDFVFTYTDQSTEEVAIRFSIDHDSLVLDSLKAISLGRGFASGEPQSVEHKIANYTYVLNVPVLMTGMYDAGLKEWDTLFATLSPTDQAAWDEFSKSPEFRDNKTMEKEYESRLERALPNIDLDAVNKGSRKLSDEEKKKVDEVVRESARAGSIKILYKSRLSDDAKRKIEDYLAAKF
jgi:hypothetical protein